METPWICRSARLVGLAVILVGLALPVPAVATEPQQRTAAVHLHGGFPDLLGLELSFRLIPQLELEASGGFVPSPEGGDFTPGGGASWVLLLHDGRSSGTGLVLELPLQIAARWLVLDRAPLLLAGPALDATFWGESVGFSVQAGAGGGLVLDHDVYPIPVARLGLGVAF